MSDQPDDTQKQTMNEVKNFKRNSLRKTQTEVKVMLPTKEVIQQEKDAVKTTS
ncbi:thymosin beta-15A-like [Hypanus sabinus]|uniref:thymosin beta-15A-like n=1 Tax=Hypanus sabinus TaxID=79690 RepID=UPI0028C50CB1|nr:thymosin beta-15A-like [Hypanus sabinus]